MKKSIIIITLLILVGLPGCENFLDKRDPTATTFVEFFNTEEDLRRVIYSSFYDVLTRPQDRRLVLYMLDGRSDNAYARVSGDHHQLIANGNLNSNTRASEYYWTLYMKHIGRLNVYVANADVPYVEDDAIRQKYKYNMEAIRAWHYFRTTFHFGDIPFVLTPATLEEAVAPAIPQEEILETLFPMAEEIANNLPDEIYNVNAYMFSRNSFKAIVMRYALYFERYEMAARLAKEIMDSGDYELHPVYSDLFNYNADKNNKEVILVMDVESHDGHRGTKSFEDLGPHYRTGNGQSYNVPLKSLVDTYWTLQGREIDNCPLHTKQEYELDPKLNRDPRLEASIFGHGDIFQGEEIDVYDPTSTMFHELIRGSKSGYWFKKFVDEADAFRTSGNMHFPLVRYAEVLLTYAEAKIMLNDVDQLAMDCINQIRERAGLDMAVADVTLASKSQQQWIDLIRNERRIELAAEGFRYDDIIRWGIAEDVLNQPALGHTRMVDGKLESLRIEDRSFLPHQYLWPFHESTLKVEPGLTQNPGY